MVYTATNEPQNKITVDLTRASVDRPQHVSARINGFDFHGEVIFSNQWQAWFGASLPERTMFRLVLLSENQRVDRSDITGSFVAVAIPYAGMLDERTSSEFVQLNRELGRLNEIREQYLASGDFGLHSLTASLTDNTSKAQRNVTHVLAERWRGGEVVLAAGSGTMLVQPDSIFVGEDPAAWVEAIAATMFTRQANGHETESVEFDAEAAFASLLTTSEREWHTTLDRRIRLATGLGLDAILVQLDAFSSAETNRKIGGQKLRDLLLHRHGFPPGLASLVTMAYIKMRGGEAEISSNGSGRSTRVDSHSLFICAYDPDCIHLLRWLSPRHSGDWNSSLSYTSALLPHILASESGNPEGNDHTQLVQALEVTSARVILTLHTLERISGAAIERLPAVKLTRRLAPVLESTDWKSFYDNARTEFPNVAEFREAVAESSRLRVLSEDIVDVQAARDYLATADFGRADHALAKEALLLLETVDVTSILDNGTPASVELERFQAWKRRFTGSYLEHHAERRSADMELARRVKRADSQHTAVQKLAAIPELNGIYDPRFATTWGELKEQVKPCKNGPNEVSLQRQPYCIDCGTRLGSTGHEDEVEARISEIEEMLRQSSVCLSKIAASRALSGERENELRKLISINSIADLTALSQVLDDGVMSFLKRFASNSASSV